jgi:hypothetical protein
MTDPHLTGLIKSDPNLTKTADFPVEGLGFPSTKPEAEFRVLGFVFIVASVGSSAIGALRPLLPQRWHTSGARATTRPRTLRCRLQLPSPHPSWASPFTPRRCSIGRDGSLVRSNPAAARIVLVGGRQGLTLVHCSAQLEPFLTQKHTLTTLHTPYQPLNTLETTPNCTPCHT